MNNLDVEQAICKMLETLPLPCSVHCRTISEELPANDSAVIAVCETVRPVTKALWTAPVSVIVTTPTFPGAPEAHGSITKTLSEFFDKGELVKSRFSLASASLRGIWKGEAGSATDGTRLEWRLDLTFGLQAI